MTKFELEFPIHASANFIYQYISSPDSLGEWYADNVNSRGQNFTFIRMDPRKLQSVFPLNRPVHQV
ncbi:MAG: START-like domain-containing protein [Flavobacteriaceae bacterium]|nr:START-like domain-containing protein [Flavobacteriaceae bacterium]